MRHPPRTVSHGYLDEGSPEPPSRVPGTLGSSPAAVYRPVGGPLPPVAPGTPGFSSLAPYLGAGGPGAFGQDAPPFPRIVLWWVVSAFVPTFLGLLVGFLSGAGTAAAAGSAGWAALGVGLFLGMLAALALAIGLSIWGTVRLFGPGERTRPMLLVLLTPVGLSLVGGWVGGLLVGPGTSPHPFALVLAGVSFAAPLLVWGSCASRRFALAVLPLVVVALLVAAGASATGALEVPEAPPVPAGMDTREPAPLPSDLTAP